MKIIHIQNEIASGYLHKLIWKAPNTKVDQYGSFYTFSWSKFTTDQIFVIKAIINQERKGKNKEING